MPLIGCAVTVNETGLREAYDKHHSLTSEHQINAFKQSNIFTYLDDKKRNCKDFIGATKKILEDPGHQQFRNDNETIINYIYEWAKSREVTLIPIAIPMETESVYVVDGEPIPATQIDEATEKVTSDNNNGKTLTSAVSNIYSSVTSAISALRDGIGDALSQLKGASTVFLKGF